MQKVDTFRVHFLGYRSIRANKIGGQYRILGAEILRLISPDLEKKATKIYREIKEKTKKRIKGW